MVTLVGTQSNFADTLKDLIELDYDAIEAYEAAINRLKNPEYKSNLQEFKKDHERHVVELTKILEEHGNKAPKGPSVGKQWLTKGKVVISQIAGDEAILNAMLSNEKDLNTAYERIFDRGDKWKDAIDTIKRGLEDEKRHKAWFEANA